ncbi:hypothetical protein ASF60_13530 [Methylobacterium sp. Leaf113]|uniref:hypothetical protein n=1 Tax=Methylobacterium sp. Leaf113 TaxID=1736259 RepID=UPI0006F2BFC9|nr:hypothetical protein [Methylobacterium sp. Leaf113]KQP94120.1 hypothetical protein ASF60_13530 [Methylobacterium sp. Leaf113]
MAHITVLGDVDKAEGALGELMDRMDVARSVSVTPPERYFAMARKKIEGGHYSFEADVDAIKAVEGN